MSVPSLAARAVSGVKWTTVSLVGRQTLRVGTTVLLARLLSPADFGVVSMAMVLVGSMYFFRDLGASSAVIQRKSASPALVSSLFWVNLGLTLAGAALIVLVAPLVAGFFREPRVEPVLRALAVAYVVGGLSVQHQASLEKGLAFDKLAKAELAAAVAGSAVGVGAALAGLGVWSLVLQQTTISVVTSASVWVLAAWRPRLVFSIGEIRSVLGFGLNLTGSALLGFTARNADYVLIGRFLGSEPLGYYTLAYNLMLMPILMVAQVIDRVVFPVYSRLQDDLPRLRQSYLKVVGAIALAAVPALLGLMVVAEPFVLSFFGEKWLPVVALIVVLAPVGLLELLMDTGTPLYMAMGRTDWMFRWDLVATSSLVAAYAIGIQGGLVGVAVAYAITASLLAVPSLVFPFRLVGLRLSEAAAALWRPVACGAIMLGAVLGASRLLPADLPVPGALASLVAIGAVAYGSATWLLNPRGVQILLDVAKTRRADAG